VEGERGVVVLEEGSGWEGEEWLKYHRAAVPEPHGAISMPAGDTVIEPITTPSTYI
jgi:hypothetical protein